jgi:hypothetical protein
MFLRSIYMTIRATDCLARRGRTSWLRGLITLVFLVGLTPPATAHEMMTAPGLFSRFPRADENLCADDSACQPDHFCVKTDFFWFDKRCSSDRACIALPPGGDENEYESEGCIQSGVPRRYLNRCLYSGFRKRCVRRWRLSDPAYLTNVACQKSHDCPSRLTCTSFDSDETHTDEVFHRSHKKNQYRCAYLPERVWPSGTKPRGNVNELPPKWFKSGGPLPAGFPHRWDLRRGPLPSAPEGYFWVYAPLGECGGLCHRGFPCDHVTSFPDDYFEYVLMDADWPCLDPPGSFVTP